MRILLIEDHDDTAAAVMRVLVREGHLVERADSCQQAKSACANRTFDLLLCDLSLPDGDGWSLMSHLRDAHGLRGIALSAHAHPDDHERSLAAGFMMHVDKPMTVEVLLAALRTVEEQEQREGVA
jgi:DNA-binding response OmpR family regulator